jgi:DNA-binding MarR family transcriptional regulator
MPYNRNGTPYSEPTTSRVAARMLTPERVGTLCSMIRFYVQTCGAYGSTCEQAEEALGLEHETCSARFRQLELAGWLIKTTLQRPTHTGKPAFVYITGKGVRLAVAPRVRRNIDWTAKPLGPLDYAILRSLVSHPRRCKEIEHVLDRDHEAVSGNLRHLVQRRFVEKYGSGMNPSGRPAALWRLTDSGTRVLIQKNKPFASFRTNKQPDA